MRPLRTIRTWRCVSPPPVWSRGTALCAWDMARAEAIGRVVRVRSRSPGGHRARRIRPGWGAGRGRCGDLPGGGPSKPDHPSNPTPADPARGAFIQVPWRSSARRTRFGHGPERVRRTSNALREATRERPSERPVEPSEAEGISPLIADAERPRPNRCCCLPASSARSTRPTSRSAYSVDPSIGGPVLRRADRGARRSGGLRHRPGHRDIASVLIIVGLALFIAIGLNPILEFDQPLHVVGTGCGHRDVWVHPGHRGVRPGGGAPHLPRGPFPHHQLSALTSRISPRGRDGPAISPRSCISPAT